MTLTRAAIAAMIDHTLLRPDATPADIERAIAEATEVGVFAICVPPAFLPVSFSESPTGRRLAVVTVCGFPTGLDSRDAKVNAAAAACATGADEVDMVIDPVASSSGDWGVIEAEVLAVRAAMPAGTLLKVILETAALTDDGIVTACQVAEYAGADFVKTSTGFHPGGGATVEAVRLMAATVGGRLGIKASGGIRDTTAALALVEAGATRLGTSASRAVLDGLPG